MKVYTANERGVTLGAMVTPYQLTSGREIAAVSVGEEGRGRWVGFVPVRLTPAAQSQLAEKGETIIFYVAPWKAVDGDKMVFDQLKEDHNNSTGHVCLVLNFAYGYRGTVTYEFPENVNILADGCKADGAAGRMAGGCEYVILMEGPGIIRVHRTGRLYGGESDFLVVVKGGDVTLTTPNEAWLEDL